MSQTQLNTDYLAQLLPVSLALGHPTITLTCKSLITNYYHLLNDNDD